MKRHYVAAGLIAAIGLGGCTVSEVIDADETALVVSQVDKEESMLLDVGIIEFDAGIPENNNPDKSRVYDEIRDAEARYLAYHLKHTMQGTGHWGAVRVLPSEDAFTDVIVTATIVKSDGEFIELDVAVSDTSGREWYEKSYETQTGVSSYSEKRDRRKDPYQKVFNDIANDLHDHAATLPSDYVANLQ